MKSFVNVSFVNNAVSVEGNEVEFASGISVLPIHETLANIYWNNGSGELEGDSDHPLGEDDFQFAEDEYEKHVAPYVLQWEAECSRQEAEKMAMLAEEEAEYNSPESTAERLRQERDDILRQTDYLMMPDYPIDADAKAQIAAYRQALRDLPQQEGWPFNVAWPKHPQE